MCENKEAFIANKILGDAATRAETILYVTYRTIERNQNITVNGLATLLHFRQLYDMEAVRGAASALVAELGFVVRRNVTLPDGNIATHLITTNANVEARNAWLEGLLARRPDLLAFRAPVRAGKRQQHM